MCPVCGKSIKKGKLKTRKFCSKCKIPDNIAMSSLKKIYALIKKCEKTNPNEMEKAFHASNDLNRIHDIKIIMEDLKNGKSIKDTLMNPVIAEDCIRTEYEMKCWSLSSSHKMFWKLFCSGIENIYDVEDANYLRAATKDDIKDLFN